MGNPTKLEAAYDRLDAWWCKLPFVRDNGKLQAAPFVHTFTIAFAASGLLIGKFVEWIGADWDRGLMTAVFVISWAMFVLIGLTTVLARKAQRDAKKLSDDAKK